MNNNIQQLPTPCEVKNVTLWRFPFAGGEIVPVMMELKVRNGRMEKTTTLTLHDMTYEAHYDPSQNTFGFNSPLLRVKTNL